MLEQRYPEGWDEKRVKVLIAHYDALNVDDDAQEIEDAMNEKGHSRVLVPNELVRDVVALIAQKKCE